MHHFALTGIFNKNFPHDAMLAWYMPLLCVCCIVSKWLNVVSCKQSHMIAQGL